MATGNFYADCGEYFVIDAKDIDTKDWDSFDWEEYYNGIIESIINDLKAKGLDVDVVEEHTNSRDFPGLIFGEISNYFMIDEDDEERITINLILRSGYYDGANLDYNIDGVSVDDWFDSEGFYDKDIEKEMEDWVDKTCDIIESVYEKYSNAYVIVYKFSNGETGYKLKGN